MFSNKTLRILLFLSSATPLAALIIFSIYKSHDSDKFPVILAIDIVLVALLVFTVFNGIRAVRFPNNQNAYINLFIAATIVAILPGFLIFRSLWQPSTEFIGFVIIAVIMIVVWLLNLLRLIAPVKGRGAD